MENIPVKKIEDIPGLDTVPDTTRIARYFTKCKLKKLIANQELWFANADIFPDKKERTIPNSFFKNFKPEQEESYQTLNELKNKYQKAYISCWTVFDDENYALWKIYDRDSNGACLITTAGKLMAALQKARQDTIAAKVEYVDLSDRNKKHDMPWITYAPKQNMPIIRMTEKFKQKPYKYEEEIRFIVYGTKDISGFGVNLDLPSLIDEAIISPFSNEIVAEETRALLKNRFDEKIIRDSIIVV